MQSWATNRLPHVRVASPCPANWDEMLGNNRVRFCGQCKLNVYNLSGMTRQEADAVLTRTEGRLCVRVYQRADGTILTEDCPVGLQAVRQRLTRIATAVLSAVFGWVVGVGAAVGWRAMVSTSATPGLAIYEEVLGERVLPHVEMGIIPEPLIPACGQSGRAETHPRANPPRKRGAKPSLNRTRR